MVEEESLRVMEAGFPMQKKCLSQELKEKCKILFVFIFTFYLSRILTHFLQIISDYCIAYFFASLKQSKLFDLQCKKQNPFSDR